MEKGCQAEEISSLRGSEDDFCRHGRRCEYEEEKAHRHLFVVSLLHPHSWPGPDTRAVE